MDKYHKLSYRWKSRNVVQESVSSRSTSPRNPLSRRSIVTMLARSIAVIDLFLSFLIVCGKL